MNNLKITEAQAEKIENALCAMAANRASEEEIALMKDALIKAILSIRASTGRFVVGSNLPIESAKQEYPAYAGQELVDALLLAKEWVKSIEGCLSVAQRPFQSPNELISVLSKIANDRWLFEQT